VSSGFNTDIEFQGTVYHVQTEDKGLPAKMIMSLVYDRGTILASKRASYEDLAGVDFDEKELSERLARQHHLICAAVKAGRIDDLKKMTAKSATARANTKSEAVVAGFKEPELQEPMVEVAEVASPVPILRPEPATVPRPPIKIAMVELERIVNVVDPDFDELILDAVHVIEDEEIIPAEDIEIIPDEAVAVVSELSGRDRTANSKLSLELLGETKFKGGDRRTVNIMLCRGTERKVVPDSQILIKVLGSSFRPVIFHAKTDANGLARVHLQLPHFQAGRAALLVRAIAGGEEIELRRVVTPG